MRKSFLGFMLLLVAGVCVLFAAQPTYQAAPLPTPATSSAAGVVGETGQHEVAVTPPPSDISGVTLGDGSSANETRPSSETKVSPAKVPVSADTMMDDSVFIPQVGLYSRVIDTDRIVSHPVLEGWRTIAIPDSGSVAAWVVAGKGQVVAGHVSFQGQWSTWYSLHRVSPGNVVWTFKDGVKKKWVIREVFSKNQHEFPQEVWNLPDDVLVLVTCGGTFDGGHYSDNVFVKAYPA